MTNVLIAVHNSESSLVAARAAHRLFGDDADYTVISVAVLEPVFWGPDPLMMGVGYSMVLASEEDRAANPLTIGDMQDAQARTLAESAQRTAHDMAEKADLRSAHAVGEAGDPCRVILAEAQRCSADVIVVGSHDRSWFRRLLEPPLSGALVRNAHVPVLVVH